MVEHRTHKAEVAGSIPAVGTESQEKLPPVSRSNPRAAKGRVKGNVSMKSAMRPTPAHRYHGAFFRLTMRTMPPTSAAIARRGTMMSDMAGLYHACFARATGFEPATFPVTGERSNQLSYARK